MKRFLWELYLFGVMGYMVTEYTYNGGILEPEPIQMGTYLSKGTGYKIPPSFKLAGYSFIAWGIVGAFRLANTCPHNKTKHWQTGYGGHYIFQCDDCGKIWEETR